MEKVRRSAGLLFNATKHGIDKGMLMFLLNCATEWKYSLSVFDAKSVVLFKGISIQWVKNLYHAFKTVVGQCVLTFFFRMYFPSMQKHHLR